MPNSPPQLPQPTAALPLWMICGSLTIIVLAAVAAWLVRSIARQALAKAEPKDVADVVLALSRLLDRFHGFVLPSRGNASHWDGPAAAGRHGSDDHEHADRGH